MDQENMINNGEANAGFVVNKLNVRRLDGSVHVEVGLTDTGDVIDEFGTYRSASGLGAGENEVVALTEAVRDAGQFFPDINSQPLVVESHDIFPSQNGEFVVTGLLRANGQPIPLNGQGVSEQSALADAVANGMKAASVTPTK